MTTVEPPPWRFHRPAGATRSAHIVMTSRADGDLRVTGEPNALEARRRAVADSPWTWLHQVHGAGVVVVDAPGEHAGVFADAAVTSRCGAVLAVHSADCAPVVLVGDGAIGVVHAGWRGIRAGVLPAAVQQVRDLARGPRVDALLGPCISPESYEFSEGDLEALVAALGPSVRATTAQGRPALDLTAAVAASLEGVGVHLETLVAACTAEASAWLWSHRARADAGRQATVAWLDSKAMEEGP